MEEFNIEKLVSEINFEENSIAYIKNDIVLTQKEVDILKDLDFNYEGYTNMSSLLMALNDLNDDELDEIIQDIADRNYYLNTNK